MPNVIKMKQSSVAAKVPTTGQLSLGELAINTTDGKLYLKKNVTGVESIIDVTAPDLTAATGVLAIANGGTGASTLAGAQAALASDIDEVFSGFNCGAAATTFFDLQIDFGSATL